MSDRNRRPASGHQPAQKSSKGGKSPAGGANAAPRTAGSHSASGTARAGRRETERTRPPQPATPTLIDQIRKPLIVSFVIFMITAGVLFAFVQTTSPVYACGSVDTVQSPTPGELGQVQADQGNQHVLQASDKITYAVCPPASGRHINQTGFGPLQPKVYGPDDKSVPNGWVHNLEHGGLVLLYSCDKGACDSTSIAGLQAFSGQFPTSPVCQLPAGYVGPVVARFDQMPTKYAALLWGRALYLDTLDTATIDQFFLRYGERLSPSGAFIAPPEPQCAAPTATPAASTSPAPSASGG